MSRSLFFDYPCRRGDGEGRDERAVPTGLSWCKSEDLLACALDSGRVAIYQDEVHSTGYNFRVSLTSIGTISQSSWRLQREHYTDRCV